MKLAKTLLLILINTFAFATTYPLTVQDALGREITLRSEPVRVVTMLPSQTETLCALNACDKLVATDDYSNYPPDVLGLPKVGSSRSPNVEGIIDQNPDLVLVAASAEELVTTLESLGLTVYASGVHSSQTLAQALEEFANLGELVNRTPEAAMLVTTTREHIDTITNLTKGAPRPTVFYEISEDLHTPTPNSFLGELITAAGGENIIPEGDTAFPQVEAEVVIATSPEVVILADAPYSGTKERAAARPGWEHINAFQNDRVYTLTQEQIDILSRPTPRMAEAVRLLAQLFHPDLRD